ncbi:MAG: TonB-dependent receptor domain-containing protein [Bacteroidota bacterium]
MALVVGGGMRRAGIWLGLGLGLAVAQPVWADSPVMRLDIPAQTLDAALQELAAQSHAQIIYDSVLVQGRTSPGVRGELSPAQGLARLLRGSGLKAVPNGDNGFALAAGAGENTVMEPVVVTATKTPVAAGDLPVSVTVVDKDEIARMPAHDLSDVLRRVPGVDIQRNSSTGIATVSMRGMGYQRTSVLIDGQPAEFMSPSMGGRSAIQVVDPENVERIEVVRGAGSALYGSNAMGGVINVITKQGVAGKPESEVHSGWTSRDTKSAGASTRGGIGKVTYSLTADYEDAAGYKPLRQPTPDTEDFNLNNVTWRDRRLGGNVGVEVADGHNITLGLNDLFNDSNQFGRPNTDSEVHDTVLSLGSSHQVTKRLLLSSAFGWRHHKGDYNFDSYGFWWNPDTSKTSVLEELGDKFSAEVKAQWDATDRHRLLAGGQYTLESFTSINNDPTTGTQSDDRGGEVRNLGGYLQDEIAVTDQWGVTVGARYDQFDYDLSYRNYATAPVTARTVERSWQAINPRIATRYDLTEQVGLRASAGTAFRAPDTFGLMGRQLIAGVLDFQPNPDLKAERSINYDIGTDVTPWTGMKIGVTGFYSSIRDAIAIRRWGAAPITMRFENIGQVESRGVELEATQRFAEFWSVNLGYTFTDARVRSEAPSGVIGWPEKDRRLNMSPAHKLVTSLGYDQPDFLAARLDGRYVSTQYGSGDTGNDYVNRLAPYFTADASATYTLPVGDTRLLVTGAITNLLDRQYVSASPYYLEEPRTYRLRLGWKF